MSYETREAWLAAAIDAMRPMFGAIGYTVPDNVVATCGFPSKSALSNKRQRIGECWGAEASAMQRFEIFVSPVIGEAVAVLDVLIHELVHATVGLKAKHGGAFKKCAVALGLEGKMTATHAGEALRVKLVTLADTLGAYPHGALHAMTNGEKKQSTRLIKCECPTCGYVVRTTAKWLERGAPWCRAEHDDVQMVATAAE